MKTRLAIPGRGSRSAFTMIEIAIALAVIAFALVAIIGILPTGLQVQKENLADTIINQDGAYFMEAIRSGARGLDELTNSVESIDVPVSDALTTFSRANRQLLSGAEIVGLLSYPVGKKKNGEPIPTTAVVRALSGAASEKGSDKDVRDLAFKYELEVRIINFPTSPQDPFHTPEELTELNRKLFEIRLEFRWPILANGETGNGRRVFRSLVSADQITRPSAEGGHELFFFQH